MFNRLLTIFLSLSMVLSTKVYAVTGIITDSNYNLPEGVSSISRNIYDLHMLIFWICVGIGIVVFGAMFYSILKHRKSVGHKADTFHDNTKIEIIWTIIPTLILIFMAIPATKVMIDLEDTSKAEMNVKITGHQWKWHYEYPESRVSFFSNLSKESRDMIANPDIQKNINYLADVDNPLVVPTNTKIRFLVTAADVIHSWWVPNIGVKQDGIPGFINDAWVEIERPGIYRGACTELCGKDHAFMPVVIDARSPAEFQKWLQNKQNEAKQLVASATKKWSADELIAKGQEVYNTNCAACHGPTGAGVSGVFPAITASPIVMGAKEEHINIVLNGKNAMPSFKVMGDIDLAAVITFQRNGLGNSVGDTIQPTDIKNVRK